MPLTFSEGASGAEKWRKNKQTFLKHSVGLDWSRWVKICQDGSRYRAFKKKVPTFVLLISQLPKHLKNWLCTFSFAESKNNYIFILGLKLEELSTKMWWEYHIWNGEYWDFNQFDNTLLFLHFLGFPDTLKRGFILFSTAQGVQNPKK